jgi:Zn-dependent protease/Flp pilus assembly protein TadD
MKFLGLSWSLGRLRGVDIRFHFSLLFSIPIAYYLFRPVDVRGTVEALLWVSGLLFFILLHELGHTFAAQAVGVEVKSVAVWLLGGFTNLSYRPEKPSHNLFIALAGPLVNMALAFLCVVIYIALLYISMPYSRNIELFLWLQTFHSLFFSLAILNVILVVFNLVPVYPLDGGNILHASMEMFFGRSNADRITILVSIPFLLLLVVFGFITRDYILLAFCVLIAFAVASLNRSMLRWINLTANYLFQRAGYYYLLGDFERAAQLYTKQIDAQPEHIGHYLARAGCHLMMGHKERAAADVERALKIQPKHAFALELCGEIHSLRKDYDTATEYFERAQAANPHWAVPHFDRASVLIERKEYAAALEGFNKAVSLQSRMPLFYLVRSLAHYRLGDLESAHRDQDLAVQISPNDALVMADINLMLYEDNLDWARDYYDRILAKNQQNALALQGCADACRANREFIHAVDLYTRTLKVNPREPRLYLGRGKCYLALNENEKARSDLEQVRHVTKILHLQRQAEELLKQVIEQETL